MNNDQQSVIADDNGTVIEVLDLDGVSHFYGEPGQNRLLGSEVRDGLLMIGTLYLRDGVVRVETTTFVISNLSGWNIDQATEEAPEDDLEASQ